MFRFLTTRSFFLNLLVVIAVAVLVLFGSLQLLGWFTKHGQYLSVPSVLKKNTDAAIKELEARGFDVVIQDSVYTDTAARGTVLKQLPDANSTVKVNRTVFLIVNRVTLPLVDMPALEGKSLSYAMELLARNHLKLGDTTFKPDFMQGSVLEQNINGLRTLAGAKVKWGSTVDLVIGGGLSTQQFLVPDLVGKTFSEARLILQQNGLTLAAVIADPGIRDTASAFVYKQNPPRFTEDGVGISIQPGQLVDVWLSAEMKYVKDTLEKVYAPPEIDLPNNNN